MKKTLSMVLAVMMLAVVLVACGGGGAGSTPEATVQNFINSLKNNDMNGFVKCLDPDTQEMMNEALDQMKSFGLNLSIKDILDMSGVEFDFNGAKIENVEIDGDKAYVTTTVNGETSEIPCIKVNGNWYINMEGAF